MCVCVCVCACVSACLYVNISISICIHIYIYVYIRVCVNISMIMQCTFWSMNLRQNGVVMYLYESMDDHTIPGIWIGSVFCWRPCTSADMGSREESGWKWDIEYVFRAFLLFIRILDSVYMWVVGVRTSSSWKVSWTFSWKCSRDVVQRNWNCFSETNCQVSVCKVQDDPPERPVHQILNNQNEDGLAYHESLCVSIAKPSFQLPSFQVKATNWYFNLYYCSR